MPRLLLAAGFVAALCFAPVEAGDLALAWDEPTDAMTAGFDVEVLDAAGNVLLILDAGDATALVVPGLSDGEQHGFRIRPYDRFGRRARRASVALASLPAPRIDEVVGSVAVGEETWLTLRGANFAARARAVTTSPAVAVLETRVLAEGEALVRVRGTGKADLPEHAFLVVNPVRKAKSFAESHPTIADVDGNGVVDSADVARLRALNGLTESDPGFDPVYDPNGDGVIDLHDVLMVETVVAQRMVVRAAP